MSGNTSFFQSALIPFLTIVKAVACVKTAPRPSSSKKNWRLYTGYQVEAFEPSVAPCKVTPAPYNSTKNSGLNVLTFHVPNGKVHFGCTAPKKTTSRLFFVLVSRIQNSGTEMAWSNWMYQRKFPELGWMEGDPRQSWFVQWIDCCRYCFHLCT